MKQVNDRLGRSLVINGDFSVHHETDWQVQGNGVQRREADGDYYMYLYDLRGSNGQLSQRFALPVSPLLGTYQLSFDYQPAQESGEPPLHPFVELNAYPSGRQERFELVGPSTASGVQMDWLHRTQPYTQFSPGDLTFDVCFASAERTRELAPQVDWPFRPGSLHFTRVRLQLDLQPLQLEEIELSLQGRAPRWLPEGRWPLCRGAEHQLRFVVDPACGWGGDDIYPGSAVFTRWQAPDLVEQLQLGLRPSADQGEGEQLISAPYSLDCGDPGSLPADLALEIASVYDAEILALPFPVDIGNHQLEPALREDAGYWPVQDESVRIGLSLVNPHTGLPADQVSVIWQLPDASEQPATTDSEGWAWLDYLPAASGEHQVQALYDAPYNLEPGHESFAVTAIPTHAWEQFELRLDDSLITAGRGLLILTVGQQHVLNLRPSADSLLVGQTIEVEWEQAAPPEVTIEPELGGSFELTPAGMTWQIESLQVIQRRIAMRLRCPVLKQPLELVLLQLGVGNMVIASQAQQEAATNPLDPGYIRQHQLFHVPLTAMRSRT